MFKLRTTNNCRYYSSGRVSVTVAIGARTEREVGDGQPTQRSYGNNHSKEAVRLATIKSSVEGEKVNDDLVALMMHITVSDQDNSSISSSIKAERS